MSEDPCKSLNFTNYLVKACFSYFIACDTFAKFIKNYPCLKRILSLWFRKQIVQSSQGTGNPKIRA